MKKRLTCFILCSLTALGSAQVNAAEKSDVTFSIGGMKLASENEAYNIEGKNYLPMRAIFEMLGGEVDWNKYKNEAKVEIDGHLLVIDGNNFTAALDGEPLDIDAQNIGGKIYLPVRLMGETLDYKVDWNAEERNIDIRKNNREYILLSVEDETNPDTRILTFEEAQALAEKKSSTLKNIEDSVDYLKDTRDSLGQSLVALDNAQGALDSVLNTLQNADAVLSVQLQLQETMNTMITVSRSMKSIDVNTALIKVNEQMVRDGIEITLLSQVNAIKGTELQKQLLEESIALGRENIENLTLKNELGYASDVDLKKAQLDQESLEKNLDLVKESLKVQKEALNFTLGIDAKEDVYVVCDKGIEDMSDFKLEPYIIKQKESAPSIKVLEGNVTIAEYAKRTSPAVNNESRKVIRNDLNKAQRELNDGKDSIEKNIRSAYHNLQQLELKDKQLKLDVEKAITDYNTAVVSYNAGMATAYTVKQARLGVLNAEKAVEDNKLNYVMLYETFQKPYLLGKTSG